MDECARRGAVSWIGFKPSQLLAELCSAGVCASTPQDPKEGAAPQGPKPSYIWKAAAPGAANEEQVSLLTEYLLLHRSFPVADVAFWDW